MLLKRVLAAALAATAIGLTVVVGWLALRHAPGQVAPPVAQSAADGGAADSALSFAPDGAPAITVDYPEEGSIFPPEITPPTFLWHDGCAAAVAWRIDVEFSDGAPALHLPARGEPPRVGEIDPRCSAETNELPTLAPQEASARSWTPDAETWERIKKHSVAGPATALFTGLTGAQPAQGVSRGRVAFRTSRDPLGAPIFYRDVPLMPSRLEKGVIQPIAKNAQPLIAWRLRNVAEPRSRLLLENLPTCANCHSFSRDGKTLAMDLDGPLNDKGAYVIAPIEPRMSIRDEHVMTWTSYPDKPPGHKTTGFMSQISPDGRFVVSTLNEALYVANFTDYRFLQVFYPTRGILAYYDRSAHRIRALPGADDPRYVQTSPVWTPDGKELIFCRAGAKDPYPKDRKLATYAGDPNEIPMQYDLYRIPFDSGRGGRPEPIRGGAGNGRSNSFPKVSPDGRWIVFVECRNGLLMRPDSQLYILPIEGGTPRRMRCNTARMNSWHSFSPNGRWMVFSSKSRSPYTQMFLTHLDEEGRDSPAILIPNATAANRAVNIPEFVNIPPDGLLKIDVPAAEIYRLLDLGKELADKGRNEAAIDSFRKALAIDPRFDKAHYELGVLLTKCGRLDEAMEHYRVALKTDPRSAESHNNLGVLLAGRGLLDEAIVHYRASLETDPAHAGHHGNLAAALDGRGEREEAMLHYRKAVELGGGDLAHYNLGRALARQRRFDEAIAEYQEAVAAKPGWAEAHNNLGDALFSVGRIAEAITHFERALQLKPDYPLARRNLETARAAAASSDGPEPPREQPPSPSGRGPG
ncbi:MAG: tetratricopeptide repeat protein [Thermoguttaceae bacterium]|jgi:tetratricopeptide (TPR) repeat protein